MPWVQILITLEYCNNQEDNLLLISPTSDTCYGQPLLKWGPLTSLLRSQFGIGSLLHTFVLLCFFNLSLLFNLYSPSFLRHPKSAIYLAHLLFQVLFSTRHFYPSSFQEQWAFLFSTSGLCSHGFLMKSLTLQPLPHTPPCSPDVYILLILLESHLTTVYPHT